MPDADANGSRANGLASGCDRSDMLEIERPNLLTTSPTSHLLVAISIQFEWFGSNSRLQSRSRLSQRSKHDGDVSGAVSLYVTPASPLCVRTAAVHAQLEMLVSRLAGSFALVGRCLFWRNDRVGARDAQPHHWLPRDGWSANSCAGLHWVLPCANHVGSRLRVR
jgi:hypothetical protein